VSARRARLSLLAVLGLITSPLLAPPSAGAAPDPQPAAADHDGTADREDRA